jgi:hypothetical protein
MDISFFFFNSVEGLTMSFRMGEYVEARKKDSQPFKPAQIVSVHKNGLYDISFLDQGEAFDIPAEQIRKVNDSRNDDRLKLKIDIVPHRDHKNTMKFNVGDQIEAFGSKDGLWRLAVISAVYLDSLKVDVVYSDHSRDWKIPISRIRSLNLASSGPPTVSPLTSEVSVTSFYVGMPVEARFRKGSFHFPAIVLRVDHDLKVLDLLYEEGRSECGVPFEMVRLRSGGGLVPWSGGNRNPALSKKQENSVEIEANKLHSSSIQVSNSSKEKKIAKYPLESKIQANFLLKGRYYPGKVTHFNPVDGLYSIAYDDGETEENVKEEYIRWIGKPVVKNVENSSSKKEETAAVLTKSAKKPQSVVSYQIDDRVEGNYRGKGMYYSGKIQKVYPPDDENNLFYDIEYDDGELEVKVKSQRIRRFEDNKNSNKSKLKELPISKFTEGMVVEANYKNSGRYFSGIIQKQYYKPEEETHCYDILYDDGDSELAVLESNLHFHENLTNAKFLKDDSVEGNYQNLGLFYPGRIRKVHTRFNDLYDIEYDDGEIEKRVRNVYIRPFDRPVADEATKPEEQQQSKLLLEPKYPIGLMIETNINKSTEWISGKVVNSFMMDEEVFYSVKYSSDGKEEENIPEENIRFPKLFTTASKPVDNKIHDSTAVDASDLRNDNHQINNLVHQNEKEAVAAPVNEEEHQNYTSKAVLSTPREVSSSRRTSSRKASQEPAAQPITITETGHQDKRQQKKQKEHEERGETAVGIRVECNYNNQGVWYPGVVIAEHEEDDTIDVQYDGNHHNQNINIEVETHILLERVRVVPNKKTGTTTMTTRTAPLKNTPENEKNLPVKKKKPTIVPVEEQEETENEATTSEGTTPQHRTDHQLSSPAEKPTSSFSPRSVMIEKNSLVAFQDFRRSNRKNHHWKKGRVVEIDYDQELVNIRVLAGNAGVESEIVENVSFEEIRVLKVKESSKPGKAGTSTATTDAARSDRQLNTHRSLQVKEELPESAVPAPLSLTNEDIRQLKDLLLQKNEEITRLQQSLQQTLQPIGHPPSHNNDHHNNYINHFPEESSPPVTGSGRANNNTNNTTVNNSGYFFPTTHPHAPPSLSWSSSPAVGHFTPHPPPHSSSSFSGPVPAPASGRKEVAGRQHQQHHNHHNYHRSVHSSPNAKQVQEQQQLFHPQNSSFASPRRPFSSSNQELADDNFCPGFSSSPNNHSNFHSLVPSNQPSFPFSSLPLDYYNSNNSNIHMDNHPSYQSQQMLLSMQNEIDHLKHSNQEYRERCHFLQEKSSLMTNEFFAMKSREENLLLQFNHLKASYDELTTKVNDRFSF